MRTAFFVSVLTLLTLATSACEKGLAYGDPNAVIVAAPADWWPPLQDSVFAVLSPDVFTLRNERTFRLAYQNPAEEDWGLKRMFKEEVVIGSPDDPFVAEALATLHDSVTVTAPGIYQTEEVWARNQKVTILLVDPAGDIPSQVYDRVGEVHEILDQRFRERARIRMFVSGRNEDLADSLMAMAGFGILLPEVYRWSHLDSLYFFRNDNPSPAELIRQFAFTWLTPPPEELGVDSLLTWKETFSQEYYNYPQVVDRESIQTRTLALGQMEVFEIRGSWLNPPESTWPAAGPFVLWTVRCPSQDRLYLIDAWLYAPGKDKWEYMLQIETILESFRCAGGP